MMIAVISVSELPDVHAVSVWTSEAESARFIHARRETQISNKKVWSLNEFQRVGIAAITTRLLPSFVHQLSSRFTAHVLNVMRRSCLPFGSHPRQKLQGSSSRQTSPDPDVNWAGSIILCLLKVYPNLRNYRVLWPWCSFCSGKAKCSSSVRR